MILNGYTRESCLFCGQAYNSFEKRVTKEHNKAKLSMINNCREEDLEKEVRKLMAGSKLLSDFQLEGRASEEAFKIAFEGLLRMRRRG